MSRSSPTLEGFRATIRRPSLTFAEIAWRWAVGASAWGLFIFWLIEYLDTLPVTRGDKVLLSTKQPVLVGRAIAHIFRGSLNRAVLAALFAVIALVLLWIVTASIGRAATVRALLDYFRSERFNVPAEMAETAAPRPLSALVDVSFLRTALTLSAVLAVMGAGIVVSFLSPKANPQPGLLFILFLPLAGLICFVWSALNWLLSLAGIFVVRDGQDALGAVSAAVKFVREKLGPVLAVSTWIGLAHVTAFSVAATAVSLPVAFLHLAPTRFVIAAMILVALGYLAVVDWLYMVRLAGYVCITEMPEALASPAPLPAPPPQTSIDRDELILSDLPNLAMET